jgi:tetratricopeptide (TPR) repeat protein
MVDSARNQRRLVLIRSALRNLVLLTACVHLAQAYVSQGPAVSMSTPACSVKQVNDSNKLALVFNGRVHAGEKYRCPFTPGLNFDLVPVANGWEVAIRDDKHDQNLARLTPPFNGQLPFPIQGSDFLKVGNTGSVELPQKREFIFAGDVSQYTQSADGRSMSGQVEQRHGVITITNVQLTGSAHDQNPDIRELAFVVSIQPQQEHAELAQTRPVDPQVYEAYLKGRYHWNKRTGEGVKKGAEYFQQAIDQDPTYAAAYTGLADSAGVAGWWGYVSPEQGCGKAKIAARKALEINETAEAHASLGWAILYYDWDFSASRREFQRAIELNPRYATAHQWYGHCLALMGRFDESFVELRQAIQLDPLSLIIRVSYAGFLWHTHQNDEAIEQSKKVLELDTNFVAAHWSLGHAYNSKGMYDLAVDEFQRALDLSAAAPIFIQELGYVHATAGRKDVARRALLQLGEVCRHRYVSPYWIALIHANLGERDEAFQHFEAAYQDHSAHVAHLKTDPRLSVDLRSDTRFQELLNRVKFAV